MSISFPIGTQKHEWETIFILYSVNAFNNACSKRDRAGVCGVQYDLTKLASHPRLAGEYFAALCVFLWDIQCKKKILLLKAVLGVFYLIG